MIDAMIKALLGILLANSGLMLVLLSYDKSVPINMIESINQALDATGKMLELLMSETEVGESVGKGQ